MDLMIPPRLPWGNWFIYGREAMVRRISQSLAFLFFLVDLTLTGVSWVLAYWIRFHSGWVSIEKDIPSPPKALSMWILDQTESP